MTTVYNKDETMIKKKDGETEAVRHTTNTTEEQEIEAKKLKEKDSQHENSTEASKKNRQ